MGNLWNQQQQKQLNLQISILLKVSCGRREEKKTQPGQWNERNQINSIEFQWLANRIHRIHWKHNKDFLPAKFSELTEIAICKSYYHMYMTIALVNPIMDYFSNHITEHCESTPLLKLHQQSSICIQLVNCLDI